MATNALNTGAPSCAPALLDTNASLEQRAADIDIVRSLLVLGQDDLCPGSDMRNGLNAIAAADRLLVGINAEIVALLHCRQDTVGSR